MGHIMKSFSLATSRKNSFFSILTWILMSISATILYRYVETAPSWTPSALSTIDAIYNTTHILIFVILLAHVASFIFREVEHSFLVDGIVIRRFLPLIKVIVISAIWLMGIFYILDSLNINMNNILTGTGIA